MVVEGPAQVELSQRLVRDGEGLWVNDRQLVVTQVKGAEAAESGERVGFHLGNSECEDIQETWFTTNPVILTDYYDFYLKYYFGTELRVNWTWLKTHTFKSHVTRAMKPS